MWVSTGSKNIMWWHWKYSFWKNPFLPSNTLCLKERLYTFPDATAVYFVISKTVATTMNDKQNYKDSTSRLFLPVSASAKIKKMSSSVFPGLHVNDSRRSDASRGPRRESLVYCNDIALQLCRRPQISLCGRDVVSCCPTVVEEGVEEGQDTIKSSWMIDEGHSLTRHWICAFISPPALLMALWKQPVCEPAANTISSHRSMYISPPQSTLATNTLVIVLSRYCKTYSVINILTVFNGGRD